MDDTSYLTKVKDSELVDIRKNNTEEYTRIQFLQSNGFTVITSVRFKGAELFTEDDFHKAFATKLQFPDFYGENMDAWIDVMDDMWMPYPMSKVCMTGDSLRIVIENSKKFRSESPMYRKLIECVEFINDERRKCKYLELVFE